MLQADGISRVYLDGDVHALRDVSVSIQRGEYVAIVGPSGSGKSTLLNCLGGLDQPTSGEVLYQQRRIDEPAALDHLRSREIGYVFQSFHLLPTLTAVENVQLPMFESDRSPRQRAERAAELLQRVGMTERAHHLPTKLSGGERQRVAIARSLANGPTVLLADEPTGNLDTQTGEEILDLFDELHRGGLTLLVITHSHEVAARAGRIIEFRDGKLIRDHAASDPSLEAKS